MTKKEFQALVGYEVTSKEFVLIKKTYEILYLYSKQEFCNIWKSASPEARKAMIDLTLYADKAREDAENLVALYEERLS